MAQADALLQQQGMTMSPSLPLPAPTASATSSASFSPPWSALVVGGGGGRTGRLMDMGAAGIPYAVGGGMLPTPFGEPNLAGVGAGLWRLPFGSPEEAVTTSAPLGSAPESTAFGAASTVSLFTSPPPTQMATARPHAHAQPPVTQQSAAIPTVVPPPSAAATTTTATSTPASHLLITTPTVAGRKRAAVSDEVGVQTATPAPPLTSTAALSAAGPAKRAATSVDSSAQTDAVQFKSPAPQRQPQPQQHQQQQQALVRPQPQHAAVATPAHSAAAGALDNLVTPALPAPAFLGSMGIASPQGNDNAPTTAAQAVSPANAVNATPSYTAADAEAEAHPEAIQAIAAPAPAASAATLSPATQPQTTPSVPRQEPEPVRRPTRSVLATPHKAAAAASLAVPASAVLEAVSVVSANASAPAAPAAAASKPAAKTTAQPLHMPAAAPHISADARPTAPTVAPAATASATTGKPEPATAAAPVQTVTPAPVPSPVLEVPPTCLNLSVVLAEPVVTVSPGTVGGELVQILTSNASRQLTIPMRSRDAGSATLAVDLALESGPIVTLSLEGAGRNQHRHLQISNSLMHICSHRRLASVHRLGRRFPPFHPPSPALAFASAVGTAWCGGAGRASGLRRRTGG